MNQIIIKPDTNENGRLTVWFLVELLHILEGYVEEELRGELAFSLCCLLDARNAEVFGDNVRPVVGFADVNDKNPDNFTIIFTDPVFYSSMHDWIYPIYEILKSHPKFSKIPAHGFKKEDIDQLYALI